MRLQFHENIYLTAFISYQFLIIFMLIRSIRLCKVYMCMYFLYGISEEDMKLEL